MSAVPKETPALIDFPDPRIEQKRRKEKISLPKPSIDSILQRMNRKADPESSPGSPFGRVMIEEALEESEGDDRDLTIEEEMEELRSQQRDIARIQSESIERMRVAKELEVLLAAREKVLDNREALISAQKVDAVPESDISILEQSLENIREVMDQANKALLKMEGIVKSRRSKIEQIKASGGDPGKDSGSKKVSDYNEIMDSSLAEQVAFLKEREAFIEESENVLFDKAQHLQEWEARLQQQEHDKSATEKK